MPRSRNPNAAQNSENVLQTTGGAPPDPALPPAAPARQIGARVAAARRRCGLTLAAIAARNGVSPAYLSQIEAGTANPTLRTLASVADALGVEVGALFDDATAASATGRGTQHGMSTGHGDADALRSLRRPPALRPGDRVAVLTASSPVPPALLGLGLDVLRFAGLDPVVYASARDAGTMRPYLAGDDALRAGDLMAAMTDPSIAGLIFARGGSGAQRTLAALDWSQLATVAPKVLAGYSDVTAVLEAVATRLGWASVHGPMVATDDPAPHYSLGSLLRTLMAPERAMTLCFPEAVTVVPGRGRGLTLGGNLSLLAATVGTDTCRPAAGGLLLIEDDAEPDYKIDRMLTQLRRSGYLDGVAGIITGAFTNCGPPELIGAILAERLGDLGAPMISWANIGHGGRTQAFPIGIAAELDADAGTVRLLEPPLVPSG
jgi:muramoyltetrapeptide carboxypeptidase